MEDSVTLSAASYTALTNHIEQAARLLAAAAPPTSRPLEQDLDAVLGQQRQWQASVLYKQLEPHSRLDVAAALRQRGWQRRRKPQGIFWII